MYGKRACIALRTLRDIVAGEEVTIDYGDEYFDAALPCQCGAFTYPHTSEQYRRRVHGDGSVSPRGIGTYGNLRSQHGGGSGDQASSGLADKGASPRERVEDARVRETKTRPKTLEKKSAPTVSRRRSRGSRRYKGGDPDRNPLRRSTRIAAIRMEG
ncbi:putative set domain-containing protein [Diaporthe ampelina]|uniref:Putative set domain-containing protein n=1 Tax=Diaporthe ampelina TaxID=1214573 RepID=A0A0G2FR44_9PEZI|nr:putative set domain-containing protein [Diaporthe ampelina]